MKNNTIQIKMTSLNLILFFMQIGFVKCFESKGFVLVEYLFFFFYFINFFHNINWKELAWQMFQSGYF